MVRKGSIRTLSITNFVTYSDVVLRPGSNLNLIIGPNGTGKSTVLSAIILGLAGTPKVIGRGNKVSEYIRQGCNEAVIGVELYGDEPDITFTIRRKFNNNNHNQWFINEKQTTEQDIKAFIYALNIQVNNLCQCLPQDRVQDFIKMDKKELLLNTMLALGRQDLIDTHAKLISIQNQLNTLAEEIGKCTSKYEQVGRDNDRLEGKVQNFKDRKKYLLEAEHIKRKICWNEYQKFYKKKLEIEKDLRKIENILIKHKKKVQPVEDNIKRVKKMYSNLETKVEQSRMAAERASSFKEECQKQLENITNKQREILTDMKMHLRNLEQRQKEIEAMNARIDKLTNDEKDFRSTHGEDSELKKRLDEINVEIRKLDIKSEEVQRNRIISTNKFRSISEQVEMLDKRIGEMQNIRTQRLEILRRKDKDAHKVVMWLRENKHIFKGEVYEPIALELNVLNGKHTKYLENIISFKDRIAFTCEKKEDMNTLIRTVREELGLNINVLHSGAEHPPLNTYKCPIPIDQLRQFGLYAYILSLIKAPEAILKYLCKMYSIHRIPIGDNNTYEKAGQVPAAIRLFFSENHKFFVSMSRYSGQKSTKINQITSDGSLAVCMDYEALNGLNRERDEKITLRNVLNVECEESQNMCRYIDKNRSALFKEKQELLKKLEQVKNIRDRLKATKASLEEFIYNQTTEEDIRLAASNKMKNVVNIFIQKFETYEKSARDYDKKLKEQYLFNFEMEVKGKLIVALENEAQNLRTSYQTSQSNYDKIHEIFKSVEKSANEALKVAKDLSDGFTLNDKGFDKYREKYDSFPDDEKDLQNLMDEIQLKIDCLSTVDEAELQAYEKGKKLATEYQREIETKTNKHSELASKRTVLHKQWIDPLQDIVSQINKNFTSYFQSMGCAGEVGICKEKGELEYKDYGLSIKVTFRSGELLQELNRHVQSGGERAVGTAVFLLAMQELVAVPFRCVDEINQGMDPQNERRIFEILVHATSRAETCQYFLITPKLIPDLNYDPTTQIHIVHNGQYCDTGKRCRISSILEQDNAKQPKLEQKKI